jgi:hypothetical protein
MEGWISLYRSIQEHWIWEHPIKLKWWLDILLTVNHKSKKINIGNELIECKKGQSIMSLQSWGKRWNVSKDTARNFLKLLEKDNMILLESLTKTTRLTVCKYDTYQCTLHDSQTVVKRIPTDDQTHSDLNNKDNKDNKDNKYSFKKNLLELGIEKQIVEDWLKVRKAKRAANTETAFNKIKLEIEKSNLTANECIKIAVERSWQGFKSEWLKKDAEKQERSKFDPKRVNDPWK